MKPGILLLTKNKTIKSELKQFSNRIHEINAPSQINNIFKKNGKNIEVAFLDLTFKEEEINRVIFYIKQYKKEMPVVLLCTSHSILLESEAMRNLSVYGYIKHPDNIEEIKEILEDLNNLFELDMDKKIEKVDYMETEKVFACTFKDMKKFFLKRSDVPDNVDAKIGRIVVDDLGYHFTVEYASGEKSVVPWDFVKYHCDEQYQFHKAKESKNISAKEIGKRIKELRSAAKLTQQDLADKTDIQRANIARIEAGNHYPSLETIEKIAAALSRPVAYFVAG